ncbi:hypothetical protein C1H46_008597 [Malus baccata]|uniref:MHD domain-containing protein n=1 Tax=Malus baccata TaxID=106549 RepID=A0A540N3Z5_MALBA|nr:hypothetical protein C1H46_008597 [Malus baccata]
MALNIVLRELWAENLRAVKALSVEHEAGIVAFNNLGFELLLETITAGDEVAASLALVGGGLDASEFVGPKKVVKKEGLGGLELLQTKPNAPKNADAATGGAAAGTPLDTLVKSEMKGLEMYIVEEISSEFRETLLAIVGLLGNGLFHMRTATSDEPLPILKYSLVLKLTPLPLRVCLMQRHTRSLLYVMIQYVSNPELPAPLTDVTFVLKLPLDLTLLKVSPKAVLSRFDKELKWHILEIPLNGSPWSVKGKDTYGF